MPRGPIDLRKVRRKHERFIRALTIETDKLLGKTGDNFRDHVRTKSTFKRQTPGRMSQKEATAFKLHKSGRSRWVRVKHPGFAATRKRKLVANVLEHGRGPVKARYAKALRFVIDGKVFFRKRVGPARAYAYFFKAGINTRVFIRKESRAMLRRAAARF